MLLAVGIALLIKGSDLLVDSAEKLALGVGVPVLIVGFTLVAAGTSVPELVVGLNAVLQGVGDVVPGNVVGANIANLCLILGVAALVRPLVVRKSIVRFDIPAVVVISVLIALLALDGTIGGADGLVLLAAAAVYFYFILRTLKQTHPPSAERKRPRLIDIALLAAGIIAVMAGGKITLDTAVGIAVSIGVSPYLIGLTVISIGTTLPELATSVTASHKGSGDLVLGNCLGSFSFNALVILGLCSLINPLPIPGFLDIAVMGIVAAMLMPLILRGYVLDKQEGALLVTFYVLYIAYQILMSGI
ncbi:MAG: putative membrane protein [Methanocella sp. PtaU1.Bin125]|nr:MAG: putative membrane protein [Methanocella sp. PtaU1.Bin125]